MYLEDNSNNLFNIPEESTDSSDNEGVAMQVASESGNEIEIDLYWLKVIIDKLKGLGNPTETLENESSDGLMPSLFTVSDSESFCSM